MNVVYFDHRATIEEDLGASAEHPFGGLLLSTGEAVGYDDPGLDLEPADDTWDDAHDPTWGTSGDCASCGRHRSPGQL